MNGQSLTSILLGIISLCGGGIFATNFFFVKMCIDNNKRLTVIETICKTKNNLGV